MKKKFLALLCAATMVLGASMSVCAEGSITADEAKQEAENAVQNVKPVVSADVNISKPVVKGDNLSMTVAKGGKVSAALEVTVPVTEEAMQESVKNVKVTKTDNAEVKAVPATEENVQKVAKIAEAVGQIIKSEAEKADVFNISKVEVKIFDVASTDGKAVTVTLNVGAKGANQVVYVEHATATGTERIPCTKNADGSVTFTLSSFSPVGVIIVTSDTVDESEDEPAVTTPADPGTTAPTAPKTADVFAAVLLLAAVSGTASAAFGRKAKKN